MPHKALRVLAILMHWILWVLCILAIIPVLLNVPGNPNPWELALYLVVAAVVTHYPLLLPIFAILKYRARKAGDEREERNFRLAIRGIFVVTFAVVGTMATILFMPPPPLTAEEQLRVKYNTAIGYHALDDLRAIVEGGADVEFTLSHGETPAITAARNKAWSLLAYLLERGANPDYADPKGLTARIWFQRAEPSPFDQLYAADYARLRERLGPPPAAAEN